MIRVSLTPWFIKGDRLVNKSAQLTQHTLSGEGHMLEGQGKGLEGGGHLNEVVKVRPPPNSFNLSARIQFRLQP